MTPSTALRRPALRYYGGKWRLADWIIGHLPAHTCYVEPFAGAASVLLRKPPSALEVYNDLDSEVVNFFRVLRDRPAELVRAVCLTPYSRAELECTYEPLDGVDEVERARRMFVRSWQGRGGARVRHRTGWRFQRNDNQRASVVADWVGNTRLAALADRLRLVQIESSPALDVIARFDAPDTLFYCDPPYPHATRSDRWRAIGYAHELTDEEHRQLAAALRNVRGMVAISGYPCALYDELFEGWARFTRTALTEGADRGAAKPRVVEGLWLSPAAAARARQRTLLGVLS